MNLGQAQVEGPIPAVVARIGKGLEGLSVSLDSLEGRLRAVMSQEPSIDKGKQTTALPPTDGALLGQLNERESAVVRLNERVDEILRRLQV
jgi:hypothetical protein